MPCYYIPLECAVFAIYSLLTSTQSAHILTLIVSRKQAINTFYLFF